MKEYTLEVIIQEGSDEFWDDALKDNKSGADDVLMAIESCINDQGWDAKIRLVKFEDK